MEFNAKKCNMLEIGESEKRPRWKYRVRAEQIDKVKKERDLGVIIQDNLSPEKHVNMITGGTHRLLINMSGILLYG